MNINSVNYVHFAHNKGVLQKHYYNARVITLLWKQSASHKKNYQCSECRSIL